MKKNNEKTADTATDKEPEVTDSPETAEPDEPQKTVATPGRDWYVLRVQSGREDTVLRGLEKRVVDMDIAEKVTNVLVPKESVSEIKGKRKRVVDKKLYPGYIFVEMLLDDETYHFIKETPGIGDFVGTPRKPMPMATHEVEKMLDDKNKSEEKDPTLKINFTIGDAVKITSGPFENFDGLVDEVNATKGVIVVMVTIFGRATPVELEYWQVERI